MGKPCNSAKRSKTKVWFWQKDLLFLFFHTASLAQLSSSQQKSIKKFLDGFVKERIQQGELTGAAAVLLYKDSILLKEGYGWAELETQRPFSADSTLFRLCSVTKIFTATAIMQLQEEGLLAINDPINKYIDIPQASSFPDTITIKHLLTHSGGFGERYMNMASPAWEKRLTLNEALHKYPVKRERKPGLVFAYSNYGYSLLGKIIESASGKSYEDYIKEKILDRIGMHSTLMEMPEDQQKVAKPYRPKERGFVQLEPDYLNLPPAGSILSTSADMTLFLSAHLNRRALLEEENFQLMQQRQFSNHPAIDGFGFSFFEKNRGGLLAYSHGGGWRGYNTYLFITPALKIGYFVATNTENPAVFVDPLAKEFLEYVSQQLPEGPQEEVNLATEKEVSAYPLKDFEGSYRHIRSPSDDFTSLFFELLVTEEKRFSLMRMQL